MQDANVMQSASARGDEKKQKESKESRKVNDCFYIEFR